MTNHQIKGLLHVSSILLGFIYVKLWIYLLIQNVNIICEYLWSLSAVNSNNKVSWNMLLILTRGAPASTMRKYCQHRSKSQERVYVQPNQSELGSIICCATKITNDYFTHGNNKIGLKTIFKLEITCYVQVWTADVGRIKAALENARA